MPWQYDMISQGKTLIARGFNPEDCTGNSLDIAGGSWTLYPTSKKAGGAVGHCSVSTEAVSANADAWGDPVALLTTSGQVAADGVRIGAARFRSGHLLDLARTERRQRSDARRGVCRRHGAGGVDPAPGGSRYAQPVVERRGRGLLQRGGRLFPGRDLHALRHAVGGRRCWAGARCTAARCTGGTTT